MSNLITNVSSLKTERQKIEYIQSLIKLKVDESVVRKEVGRVFSIGKSARNEKYNKYFKNDNTHKINLPKMTKKISEMESDADVGKAIDKLTKLIKPKNTGGKIYTQPAIKSAKKANKVFQVNGDKAVAEVKGVEDIRTVEDLIAYANIDMNIWEVTKTVANLWNGMWQIKAEFKRKVEEINLKQIIGELKEDIINHSPKLELITHSKDKGGLLLEITAFDLHFGKLGWAPSDGSDTDINIAREVFKKAVIELVDKSQKFGGISKILMPIGNDYLTIDNSNNTTFANTLQSVDSRFPKVFKEGRKLLVWAIDYLKQFAPVDVVYVVSNHDTDSMFHLADALECWYRNDKNVNIENSPAPRKYYRFEDNLIIYDHGDKVSPQKLAIVASTEYKDWSLVKNREFHIGHFHHEKTLIVKDLDVNSAIVRTIPALSGSDYYHNSHGYVGAKQRAQAFVWHPSDGLQAVLYSKSNN